MAVDPTCNPIWMDISPCFTVEPDHVRVDALTRPSQLLVVFPVDAHSIQEAEELGRKLLSKEANSAEGGYWTANGGFG